MKEESFNLIRPGGGRGHITIMCLSVRTTLLFMDNSTAPHRQSNGIGGPTVSYQDPYCD